MSGTCITHVVKLTQNDLEERGYLRELDVNERIILKWNLIR